MPSTDRDPERDADAASPVPERAEPDATAEPTPPAAVAPSLKDNALARGTALHRQLQARWKDPPTPPQNPQQSPRAQSREHAAILLRSVYFQVTPAGRAALLRIAKRAGISLMGRQPGNSPDPLLSLDSAMRFLRTCGVDATGKSCGTDAGTRALHDADATVVRLDCKRLMRAKAKTS